jgi:hypothetical protein
VVGLYYLVGGLLFVLAIRYWLQWTRNLDAQKQQKPNYTIERKLRDRRRKKLSPQG